MHSVCTDGWQAPYPNAETKAASKNIQMLVAKLISRNASAKKNMAGIKIFTRPCLSPNLPITGLVTRRVTA